MDVLKCGLPVTWLTVTLLAYLAGERISLALGRHPIGNPVLHATWMHEGPGEQQLDLLADAQENEGRT